jgi:diamine N-acetyltransferase
VERHPLFAPKVNTRAEKEWDKADVAFDAQDNCQKSANVNAYWEPNTLRCLDRRTGRAITPSVTHPSPRARYLAFIDRNSHDRRIFVKLRPLEREDLRFVHQLDNNASVMRYWFEEPYEAFVELSDLYDKHIHDQSERRFVIECNGEKAGLVELVEINHVHRRAEFQIIISPDYQGKGLATRAAKLAMDYGFTVLNLYKLYLIVDKENEKAIHIYRKLGFMVEAS